MDKLEQYLDQVCRSIAGPRSLRQHIRQELREHLLDAAAEHKAAGMSEEAALARALEDFGGPEQVRAELEATHGHRLLPVVIDKAMQWQERTMKAKWLWTTWAYLAAAGVIVLELSFITFSVIFLVPRFQKLMQDGIIDPAIIDDQGVSWMLGFLNRLSYVGGHYTTFLLLGAAVACGLFEWRVRSENKPFIRLSALGTVAVGLMVVVILTAGGMVILFQLGVPATGRLVRPFTLQQIATIDTSVGALEQALEKKDWEAMQEQAKQAQHALRLLANAGPAIPALAARSEPAAVAELRAQVKAADESLLEAQQAIRDKDAVRVGAALKEFHKSFGPVRDAAKKLEK
jgi:hypothetical protein